jgi:Domain of unknown function (DUF4349)
MSPPDLIAPDRLEELLRGALPEHAREARVQGMVRELRATSAPASEALRARVRSQRESARSPRIGLPRRPVLVLLALAVVGLALGAGWWREGRSQEASLHAERVVNPPYRSVLRPAAAGEVAPVPRATRDSSARAQDVDMWIELRLRDADQLSKAANDGMRITRELGGHVASSRVDTRGGEGRAELALRVPVGKVEDALFELSRLGTVTGQRVATRDLQAGIDRASRQIAALERALSVIELKLASGTLDARETLRLQIRRVRLGTELDRLRRGRAVLLREAGTAELTLALHTRVAPGGREQKSRLGGAAQDALHFLARAGSITVFLAIVLSPLVLLAVLAWLVRRARTRRIGAELLARTDLRRPQPGPEASP